MVESITVNGVVFASEGEGFGMCPYVNGETRFMLDCEDWEWSVTVKGCDLETWHETPAEALAELANQPGLDNDVLNELTRLGIGAPNA